MLGCLNTSVGSTRRRWMFGENCEDLRELEVCYVRPSQQAILTAIVDGLSEALAGFGLHSCGALVKGKVCLIAEERTKEALMVDTT